MSAALVLKSLPTPGPRHEHATTQEEGLGLMRLLYLQVVQFIMIFVLCLKEPGKKRTITNQKPQIQNQKKQNKNNQNEG